MSDRIQRFLLAEATAAEDAPHPVRGAIVQLEAVWGAVLERRTYPVPVRNLLGETTAAAALLATSIKFKGSLILQMQGRGPVDLLVVECNSDDTLRATAKWSGDPWPGPLKALLGDGRFAITIAPEKGENYQGIVTLEGDTVAQALEHFMAHSEQVRTHLWLASDGRRAAGLMLQMLPEATDGDAAAYWEHATTLAATIRPDELLDLPPDSVLRRLFHGETVRVFDSAPLQFRCSCSEQRVVAMLRMMGPAEVASIIETEGRVEVSCEFCGQQYRYDAAAAAALFPSGNAGTSATLH